MTLTTQCQACGRAIPIQAVAEYKCPSCGHDVRSPRATRRQPVAPPEPPAALPVEQPIRKPKAPRQKLHPIKLAMLVVTGIWLLGTIGMASLSYSGTVSRLKSLTGGNRLTNPYATTLDEGQIFGLAVSSAFWTAFSTTAIYAVAIGVLFVIWFATKKD